MSLPRHEEPVVLVAGAILVGEDEHLDPVCAQMAASPLPIEPDLPGPPVAAQGWGLAYVAGVVAHHHPSADREHSASRRSRLARNQLLTAMMRRPWPVVARTAWSLASAGAPERHGVWQVASRTGRALGRRAVLPPTVESRLRLLD